MGCCSPNTCRTARVYSSGYFLRQLARQHRQIGLRPRNRYARLQPRDREVVIRKPSWRGLRRPQVSRYPHVVVAQREARRHNVHQRPRGPVQHEGFPENPAVRIKLRDPGLVAHLEHGRRARFSESSGVSARPTSAGMPRKSNVFAVTKPPANCSVPSTVRYNTSLPVWPMTSPKTRLRAAMARNFRRLEGVANSAVLVRLVHDAQHHQAVRAAVGKRVDEDVVDNAEDGRRSSDPQSQRRHGQRGETAVLGHSAQGVPQIAPKACHIRKDERNCVLFQNLALRSRAACSEGACPFGKAA